jgi:tetratricopeptide (TPR) repeat protein
MAPGDRETQGLRAPFHLPKAGQQAGAPAFAIKPQPGLAALDAAFKPPAAPDMAGRPPRFLYDLGLTCAAMGDRAGAIAALRQAVAARPGMSGAWQKLAELLAQAGDGAGAAAARACGADTAQQDSEALRAKPSAGKLEAAERQLAQRIRENPPQEAGRLLRQHLRDTPADAAALRILAEIGTGQKQYPAAELLLERALDLAPHYIKARRDLVGVLMAQGKNVQAMPHIRRLQSEEPRELAHRVVLALALSNIGEFDKSLPIYDSAKKEITRDPKLLINYAYALRYAGRRAESVQACRACLAIHPGMGQAWWSLANLKNERFTPDDLAAMRGALAGGGISTEDRYSLHYALAAALEQTGEHAESFAHYASGAALKRAEQGHDAQNWRHEMRRSMAFFTEARLAALSAQGCADPAPIFILGMPRAGSTLIEQILASHSAVEGTQELPEIGAIVRDIGRSFLLGPGSAYPERLAALAPGEIAAFGARFIERTRIYRRTAKPFFIDKMPANWAYAGLILSILPNAKIIDARRHPMASCFSSFKQLFASGAGYSYDLTDLGCYYNDYLDMMAHLGAAAPGRIHRVLYEDMVEDTETEIRRLLAYCGLPFEPACLRFWESARAVATPSSEQVRQPIFRQGLEQWRHYEPWLGPLQKALDRPGLPAWNQA